eukprot:Phypoly_transcript_10256.p1 GENE.Phypoly_transcript_10256~~Phypoly_transcript_10256.p1  ORF type:complete len:246 (+),score=38.82 Phypoly_transcript_10256:563-1300(+)
MRLAKLIDERGKELHQQYMNNKPIDVEAKREDFKSVSAISTYGGFLISHLSDIRSEKMRNDLSDPGIDYELYTFGQGCECCPHMYFIVQSHRKFVWWEGPFEWYIEERIDMPRFHFYFEKNQYIQALAKLSKAYDQACGENFLVAADLPDPDDLSEDFRQSASFAAEEYEIRATDPLPHHEHHHPFTHAKHSNAPYKKGNRTYVNRKVLQSKKKEVEKHQIQESHRKKDVKLNHARKDKTNEHKI